MSKRKKDSPTKIEAVPKKEQVRQSQPQLVDDTKTPRHHDEQPKPAWREKLSLIIIGVIILAIVALGIVSSR